jgi:4a-hydroxytetrahydrobiopterin dehydratase
MPPTSRDWAKKRCVPCEGGAKPLAREEALRYLGELGDFRLGEDGARIAADYVMKDFAAAVALIGKIARIAEDENHHPDLHLTGYRRLRVELSTHAIGGLSENDFILAARIQELPKELKEPRRPAGSPR